MVRGHNQIICAVELKQVRCVMQILESYKMLQNIFERYDDFNTLNVIKKNCLFFLERFHWCTSKYILNSFNVWKEKIFQYFLYIFVDCTYNLLVYVCHLTYWMLRFVVTHWVRPYHYCTKWSCIFCKCCHSHNNKL